ncbi:hypothetical protein Q5I06_08660, partial [Helicobacter sp. faydin-H76]
NVGARFSFGKKVSDLEKQITEGKNKHTQSSTIRASKILSISQTKTGCQGCAPESGYYLNIITLYERNANLEKQLKKHSFRIYSFKNSSNKIVYTYLAGPYKTQNNIDKDKATIDKIAQWANNNKNIQPEIYEIRNK